MTAWLKSFKKITFKQYALIIIGALFSATAINIFVKAANLIPSGASGLSILIIKETYTLFEIEFNYGIIYLLLNLSVLVFVYKYLGKRFLILSLLHVALTSVFVELIPLGLVISDDLMLLAIFGGITNACGSLLSLFAGASTGGTDFVAIAYSRIKNRPMWNQIMIFNIMLLIYSGARYNWQMAFYSIIYQFISMKTIDSYHNRYKLSSLHIITSKAQEVTDLILKSYRHGITKQSGMGMYAQETRDVLYMIVNAYEVNGIVETALKADPRVFIEVSKVERIVGNYYQAPIE